MKIYGNKTKKMITSGYDDQYEVDKTQTLRDGIYSLQGAEEEEISEKLYKV